MYRVESVQTGPVPIGNAPLRLTAQDYRLPDEVFIPGAHGEILLPGAQLRFLVKPNYVDIHDPTDPVFQPGDLPFKETSRPHFNARVREGGSGEATLEWSYKNRFDHTPNRKHPGINVGWLLPRVLKHLQQYGGPIQALEAFWLSPVPGRPYMSSNWDAFYVAYQSPELQHLPPEERRRLAALSTPTGRLAVKNGYTGVEMLSKVDDDITFLELAFYRPQV